MAKTYYNKFASDDERYAEYLVHAAERKRRTYAKKALVCKACGEPRKPKKWYCDECVKAFRSWSLTFDKAQRRKQGKDDPKLAYQRKVAKWGRPYLAEQRREAYRRACERAKRKKEQDATAVTKVSRGFRGPYGKRKPRPSGQDVRSEQVVSVAA